MTCEKEKPEGFSGEELKASRRVDYWINIADYVEGLGLKKLASFFKNRAGKIVEEWSLPDKKA